MNSTTIITLENSLKAIDKSQKGERKNGTVLQNCRKSDELHRELQVLSRRRGKTREIEIGDKVRYIAEDDISEEELRFFPPKGTIGVVIKIEEDAVPYLIRWPDGTTEGDGFWYVNREDIELV